EAQFTTRDITAEHTKYAYVVGSLQPEVAQEVRDLLINPLTEEPYTKLKTELVKRTSASQQTRLNQLLHAEELGDRKPTQLYPHEMDTASLAKMADKIAEVAPVHSILSTVVSQSAPPPTAQTPEMREVRDLVAQLAITINNFSLHTSPQHARTERRRSRSPTRRSSSPYHERERTSTESGPRSIFCWYHSKFGASAKKCSPPCSFSQQTSSITVKLSRQTIDAFLTKAACFTLRTFQQSNNFSSTQAHKSASFYHDHQTVHIAKLMIFRQPIPQQLLPTLLGEYPHIIRPTTKKTAVKHNIAHHIVTRGPPCSSRPRRLPPERLKIAKNEFQHMLDKGIIRPSSSYWASPLHMVPKSQPEDWRPCGDYRGPRRRERLVGD
ncbi:gag-pol poly, partial [Paramuricea clavata]